MLNMILCLEMWNRSFVFPTLLFPTSINTAVDKVLHAMLDTFINQIFALLDFTLKRHTFTHGDLYRVHAPYRLFRDLDRSLKDFRDIIQVSLNDFDGWRFFEQFLGAGGVQIAGHSEDVELLFGLEQCVDDGAALVSCCPCDEDCFRHCWVYNKRLGHVEGIEE
jgi:hypothetical protein